MGTSRKRIVLPNQSAKLGELRALLHRLCLERGLCEKDAGLVVLAIDEVAANIIEHSTLPGQMSIEITLDFDTDSVVAKIVDEGEEFDPCSVEHRKRKLGSKRGYGIYLLRKIADDIGYQRADGKNVLRLTLPCPEADSNGEVVAQRGQGGTERHDRTQNQP